MNRHHNNAWTQQCFVNSNPTEKQRLHRKFKHHENPQLCATIPNILPCYKLKCLPTTQLHGQFKRSQSCNCISRQAPRKSTQHISGMNLVLRWQPLNLSKRTRQQTQQKQHADTSKMDGKNYWSMQRAISALQQTAAVDLWETQKAGMLHYVM